MGAARQPGFGAHRLGVHRLGVCSWSLRPAGPRELVARVRECGLEAVQLALDPIRRGDWDAEATVRALAEAGIDLLSGMMAMEGEDYSSLAAIRATGGVAPDATWETNRRCAGANARLARALGIPLVTFHAGFLPERRGDPARSRMLERLREVVDRFADEGVATAFETGQESAATLADVLEELDRPGAGVNFDPANMLLYDMGEPVEALARLAPWVRQIHVKDAVRTRVPGTWGEEVPAGAGEVDWAAFFEQVQGLPEAVDLVIEREAGEGRLSDVRTAAELVRGHVGGPARGEEERD